MRPSEAKNVSNVIYALQNTNSIENSETNEITYDDLISNQFVTISNMKKRKVRKLSKEKQILIDKFDLYNMSQ